ncbi:MAG: hypothetical protein IKD04_01880 [Clostridia bacterium]|nr:hypothetical protein [Clostridia bacterium]
MKKLNLSKRLISLLLAVLIIASAVCSTLSTFADDVYMEKTKVFDIFNQNIAGTVKNTFSMNQLNNNVTGLTGKRYSYIPYNKGAQMVWNIENITAFSVLTFNNKNLTETQLLTYYVFEASENGSDWSRLTVSKDPTYKQNYSAQVSYKLIVQGIPEGTNYIKLTSAYTGVSAWLHGIIHAECAYKEILPEPEITATYKNYYGVYANRLLSGGRASRDVKLELANMGEDSGAEITVKKNGSKVNETVYYNADEKAYCFTENGEYSLTAKNNAGSKTFEFRLLKAETETVVTKTIVDDIYNNGTTTAISRTDYADATSKIIMNIVKSSSSNITHLLPGDKYLMFPYNHGKDEPAAEAVWYSEIGFGSFTVETLNTKTIAVGDFYERTYSFYTSEDGAIWNKADFEIGDTLTEGINSSGISKELIIDEIPDGTRYIKFLSLITDDTKNNGIYSGIIRARYTTYVLLPEINARFESAVGGFINPVSNGVTVPSKVKIDFVDVDADLSGSFTVKKNGNPIAFENGDVLTENGDYEITAQNVKGVSTLKFTIDSSLASTKTEKYVFTEGVTSATEEFNRLLAEQPKGAPEGFTSGDSHIIVNDTAIIRNYDEFTTAWWGLTAGKTKIGVGSDSKGYTKDGYFYFVNSDENGNKYSGISLRHTRARMSGYPTDAYFTVYTADSFDGEYTLVKPTSVTTEPITGAPGADICNAVYYLGGAGTIVKIKFNPQAPANELWKGSLLAILELSKLTLPLIEADCNGEALVYNDVAQTDVKLSVSDEDYWFITKDGKTYEKPADGILKEDGYYTVTACNYGGTASVSFYIAKEIPVIQLIDASGNNLDNAETVDDDVRIIAYNADAVDIFKDGVLYCTGSDTVVDLNGKYTVTAENEKGIYEASVTVNRPQPTVKAYNLQGAQLADGDTSASKVTYATEFHDTCTITLDGKKYSPEADAPLTEEGVYVIEVENKAGKASLSFTIKYNLPLAPLKHAGNTVAYIDYENGDKFNKFQYSYSDTIWDNSKALRSDWTGFTGPIVRSTVTGDASGNIIYKCAGFKSFALYAVYLPAEGMTINDMYEIYASTNGKDFTKLEYTEEQDISYQTTGYVKYRLNAQGIPEDAKYIKVVINGQNASAAWSRCIPKVEFSYNKEDVGKLDVNDIIFMLEEAEEGGEVQVDLLNSDTVIPKEVFEKIQFVDKSLTVNLLDKNLGTAYKLTFNGLEVNKPMDFNIKLTSPDNAGLKAMKEYDAQAQSVSFAQGGDWTVSAQLTMLINPRDAGKKYALYRFESGEFELIDRMMAPATGYLVYTVTKGGDYVFTLKTDLLDDIGSDDQSDLVIEEAQNGNTQSKGTYVMVVNRKKFVPAGAQAGGFAVWAIVLICVGAAAVTAGVATAVVLIVKKKRKP